MPLIICSVFYPAFPILLLSEIGGHTLALFTPGGTYAHIS